VRRILRNCEEDLIRVLAAAILAAVCWAQTAPNPAFAPVTDDPKLPRVLLIGDSISIGYTIPVRKQLAGVANVHRIPENAAFTGHGLKQIDGWLGDGRWDVIHFNFGLHDLKRMEDGNPQVSLADYASNLRQLVARLKPTGAALIFATTTPVPEGKVSPPRVPADVARYNEAALRVMKENGVAIDDLYAFALSRLSQIQQPANVHYTEAGYDALAGEVTRSIRTTLRLHVNGQR
jgi:lysophospholipase L1-like esterase